jgi:hypothetical protein
MVKMSLVGESAGFWMPFENKTILSGFFMAAILFMFLV